MPKFSEIPTFTRSAGYMVNVGLDYLARHYTHYVMDYGLDVSPDFQRGYVWSLEQKIRFMEYMLRGGTSGLDIYMNSPTWQHGSLSRDNQESWFVLVDGKQRLDAALGFLNNEFPVFGHYYREFTDRPSISRVNFRWHVNDLKTWEEVRQWYLDLNTGGTVHTEDELKKVRTLLETKVPYVRPSPDELVTQAGSEREIFQQAIREEQEEQRVRDENYRRHLAEEAAKPKRRRKTS